jgi:hypothetical protein
MEEKLLLTLVDNRRLLNENFDNFSIKMLIIREIFDISDISNELLQMLLLVCGIDEDGIILKLFTSIDDIYIITNQLWLSDVKFRRLDLNSIKNLCKIDVYFLRGVGFNIIHNSIEFNIKIKITNPLFFLESTFLSLLKNKVTFELITTWLPKGSGEFGRQVLINNVTGTNGTAIGYSALGI